MSPSISHLQHAWELMNCFCATFIPSSKGNLLRIVASSLLNETKNTNSDFKGRATSCLEALRSSYCQNFGQHRRLEPTFEEYMSTKHMKLFPITVHFFDGYELEVPINSNSTAKDVFQKAIVSVGLKKSSHVYFSLVEVHNELSRILHPAENIADILSKWATFKALKDSPSNTDPFGFGLFIKQTIFVHTKNDLVQQDLLFHQSIVHILRGNWATDEHDAVELGALQCCFEEQTQILDTELVPQYIPKTLLHHYRIEG